MKEEEWVSFAVVVRAPYEDIKDLEDYLDNKSLMIVHYDKSFKEEFWIVKKNQSGSCSGARHARDK